MAGQLGALVLRWMVASVPIDRVPVVMLAVSPPEGATATTPCPSVTHEGAPLWAIDCRYCPAGQAGTLVRR